jgi:aspartate-semialdehyde dehydrogenase
MSARRGRRVAVIGASGTLGSDLIAVLEERSFPLAELVPVATDHSLGESVEIGGESLPMLTGEVGLRGVDVAFLCLPAGAAPGWARQCLREEVPCIDISGSFAGRDDVPVLAADLALPGEQVRQPLVVSPPGPALALSLALGPLHARFGLRRVVGTSLESASGAGREGIRTLEAEVVALFNQSEPPEPTVFAGPVAFDCVPELGHPAESHGADARERAVVALLQQLLGARVPIALTRVRVPTFVGLGASVAVETREPAPPEAARETLLKAGGVELWDPDAAGPSTRDATARGTVLIGRMRSDPTAPEGGLLLWLAADPVRLAATNAVRIAEARFASR